MGMGMYEDEYGSAPPIPELDFEARLRRIVDDARSAMAEGGTDSQEALLLEQLTSIVAKIRAKRAKEEQAALGTSPAMKFMSRAAGL